MSVIGGRKDIKKDLKTIKHCVHTANSSSIKKIGNF